MQKHLAIFFFMLTQIAMQCQVPGVDPRDEYSPQKVVEFTKALDEKGQCEPGYERKKQCGPDTCGFVCKLRTCSTACQQSPATCSQTKYGPQIAPIRECSDPDCPNCKQFYCACEPTVNPFDEKPAPPDPRDQYDPDKIVKFTEALGENGQCRPGYERKRQCGPETCGYICKLKTCSTLCLATPFKCSETNYGPQLAPIRECSDPDCPSCKQYLCACDSGVTPFE